MEYVYAALLLHKAGQEITEDKLKGVIDASGVKADDARIKAMVSSLKGVDIEDALKNASAVAVAAPAQAGGEASKGGEGKKEEPSEEDQEEAEESASAGLAALFG